MVLKIKTISNEVYKVEIDCSFDDYMKDRVLGDGYLRVSDTIKRPTWINTKYIESVSVMEDKQND